MNYEIDTKESVFRRQISDKVLDQCKEVINTGYSNVPIHIIKSNE